MSDQRHILRGGLSELVFYTGAGDVHSVGARVRGSRGDVKPAEDVEYFEGADGQDYVERREWKWAPGLVDQADIDVVKRWKRKGKQIGVIGLGPQALLWRELVPILLEDASGKRGELGGQRLRMRTRLVEADVVRSPDLLAGADLSSGGGQVALPVPGMLLRIEAPTEGASVTAEARAYDGNVLESATAAPVGFLELPEGTFYVYASGPARAEADRDAFALVLVEETGTSVRLRAYGTDTAWQEQPIGDLSFKGTNYPMPTQVTVPPGAREYLQEESQSSAFFTLQA